MGCTRSPKGEMTGAPGIGDDSRLGRFDGAAAAAPCGFEAPLEPGADEAEPDAGAGDPDDWRWRRVAATAADSRWRSSTSPWNSALRERASSRSLVLRSTSAAACTAVVAWASFWLCRPAA